MKEPRDDPPKSGYKQRRRKWLAEMVEKLRPKPKVLIDFGEAGAEFDLIDARNWPLTYFQGRPRGTFAGICLNNRMVFRKDSSPIIIPADWWEWIKGFQTDPQAKKWFFQVGTAGVLSETDHGQVRFHSPYAFASFWPNLINRVKVLKIYKGKWCEIKVVNFKNPAPQGISDIEDDFDLYWHWCVSMFKDGQRLWVPYEARLPVGNNTGRAFIHGMMIEGLPEV